MGPIAEHRAVCFIAFPTKTRIHPHIFCADKLRETRKTFTTYCCGIVTIARLKRTYSAKITQSGVPDWQPLASSHIKLNHFITFIQIMQHFFITDDVENYRTFVVVFVNIAQTCACFCSICTFFIKNIVKNYIKTKYTLLFKKKIFF